MLTTAALTPSSLTTGDQRAALAALKDRLNRAETAEEIAEICRLEDEILGSKRDACLEALHEIDWLCEGRADIDWNGGPNLAMQIQTVVSAALAKFAEHS